MKERATEPAGHQIRKRPSAQPRKKEDSLLPHAVRLLMKQLVPFHRWKWPAD